LETDVQCNPEISEVKLATCRACCPRRIFIGLGTEFFSAPNCSAASSRDSEAEDLF
jgi:hypothetical protein